MKLQKVHLFIILLLGLVLCGCLGTRKYMEGMDTMSDDEQSSDNSTSSALPDGVPQSQIPPGQQDMYILKSEVVPPVCPICPPPIKCPKQDACQPCPPCARCPEPAFECKKVPNYSSSNISYLPRPVLADFSQFGL
jgi:hypothetical protein